MPSKSSYCIFVFLIEGDSVRLIFKILNIELFSSKLALFEAIYSYKDVLFVPGTLWGEVVGYWLTSVFTNEKLFSIRLGRGFFTFKGFISF